MTKLSYPPLLLSIDTETGGFDPLSHSLLTLAVVPIVNGRILLDDILSLEFKRDVYHVTADALKVNNIDLVHLYQNGHTAETTRYLFSDTIYRYEATYGPAQLLGQNLEFDLNFLRAEWYDLEHMFQSRPLIKHDTKMMADQHKMLGLYPQTRSTSLLSLCQHYRIDLNGAHNSRVDAIATAQVYLKQLEVLSKIGMSDKPELPSEIGEGL